jgi:5-methylcytosine-specific restriction endonuclease McrA
MSPDIQQLCVICGKKVAKTVDHVPPKNLFVKPRPSLITIPACFDCNNSASPFDEQLMIYVSLQIGPEQDRTKKLWKTKALKALHRNKPLQREIIGQMKRVWLTTESGVLAEKGTVFLA